MTPDQEKAACAELVHRVANLNILHVVLVTAAVDAIERCRGSITPPETFPRGCFGELRLRRRRHKLEYFPSASRAAPGSNAEIQGRDRR